MPGVCDAPGKMIGQLGGAHLMRQAVRVDAFLQQLRGVFPDRVVACHEHHAALLQGRDGIAAGAEHALGILMRRGIGGHVLYLYQCVSLEVAAGHRGELIFVPIDRSACGLAWCCGRGVTLYGPRPPTTACRFTSSRSRAGRGKLPSCSTACWNTTRNWIRESSASSGQPCEGKR